MMAYYNAYINWLVESPIYTKPVFVALLNSNTYLTNATVGHSLQSRFCTAGDQLACLAAVGEALKTTLRFVTRL